MLYYNTIAFQVSFQAVPPNVGNSADYNALLSLDAKKDLPVVGDVHSVLDMTSKECY